MTVAAGLAAMLVIGMAVPACSPVMTDYNAAAGITMPGTTAAAASDLSLESATPGAPASSKAASVPAPPVSITVMETVQVSDGQQETSHSPLHAARSLSLSRTSLYQWAHNIIAGFGSPSDSMQGPSAAMVDVTQPLQAPYDPKTLTAVPITINESVVVSDAPQVLLPISILVNESIVVSDTPQVLLPVSILVNESIVVSDTSQVALPLSITVNENISVYDAAELGSVSQPAAGIKLIDTDINRDGKVDERDLGLLRASYGCLEKDAVFNPHADLIKDGRVDLRDLAIWGASYPGYDGSRVGESNPQPSP